MKIFLAFFNRQAHTSPMGYNLVNFSNRHRICARYLACGIALEEICSEFGWNLTTWRQIVNSPLFKQELNRLSKEIEDKIIEDSVRDPVLLRLRTASLSAAKLLESEVRNFDSKIGATASSRIKAAAEILDRTGYNHPEKVEEASIIHIHLGQEQLNSIRNKKVIDIQPDQLIEHALSV